MATPSLAFDAFLPRWRAGDNQILSLSVVSDLETPVSAMLKLGKGKPFTFLLESIEGGEVRGRYSIIGREPDLIWRCGQDGQAAINAQAQTDSGAFVADDAAPLDSLRRLLARCRIAGAALPQPVASGLFGFLGYDMVRQMEHLPNAPPDELGLPDALLIRPSLLAIFDQIENSFTLATPVWHAADTDPRSAYDDAVARLDRALADLQTPLPAEAAHPAAAPQSAPRAMTEDNYVTMVATAKDYIAAGDIFQVVLSQRFSQPFALPPLALYRAIRRMDPSPFLFIFDFGGFAVVGSSPEILVRLRDGTVTVRPIAGTRPRGSGNRTDADMERELLADPKEVAEHLMLLDLGRNDVGRVAKTGSVNVTARNGIERYRHVMHIVSNVEGALQDGLDALDALTAGFPAGTVSGAPKVRAMQIIDAVEGLRRNVYGGCVGYFGSDGDMDTCIAIRTAVIKDGAIHVQAGAGIVHDSDPHAEYRECVAKARGMLRAAEAAAAFAGKG